MQKKEKEEKKRKLKERGKGGRREENSLRASEMERNGEIQSEK